MKVSYDRNADILEVEFSPAPGIYFGTKDPRVEIRVDDDDNVLGFLMLNVTTFDKDTFIDLKPVRTPSAVSKRKTTRRSKQN
ncbi:MAG: DUF2283 domain-containing protein [Chloroflexi bacterium]|nr:DUF2283 domain-containing protein [Chloroflexota bacterium]